MFISLQENWLKNTLKMRILKSKEQKQPKSLHWPRLELGSPAWQASILPLDHQCLLHYLFIPVLSCSRMKAKKWICVYPTVS